MALTGSHYWLSIFPLWGTALLLIFFSVGILHIGRAKFEGLSYNVALSSEVGDVALSGVILIAATILQRESPDSLPSWAVSTWTHIIAVSLAAWVGVVAVRVTRMSEVMMEVMDIYHHTVIVPGFMYLLVSTTPVIYSAGTDLEWYASLMLFAAWFALSIFDTATGRMKQRNWLARQGLHLP